MIVKCIGNQVSTLASESVRRRVSAWTSSEGEYQNLEIEGRWPVQAVEYLDDGLWFYLHTIEESEHPYPYASEFFVIEDSRFPDNWSAEVQRLDEETQKLKRISFDAWARDDAFFEKLVNGDPVAVSIYKAARLI